MKFLGIFWRMQNNQFDLIGSVHCKLFAFGRIILKLPLNFLSRKVIISLDEK